MLRNGHPAPMPWPVDRATGRWRAVHPRVRRRHGRQRPSARWAWWAACGASRDLDRLRARCRTITTIRSGEPGSTQAARGAALARRTFAVDDVHTHVVLSGQGRARFRRLHAAQRCKSATSRHRLLKSLLPAWLLSASTIANWSLDLHKSAFHDPLTGPAQPNPHGRT